VQRAGGQFAAFAADGSYLCTATSRVWMQRVTAFALSLRVTDFPSR